jgi:hypothetical protein
MKLRDVLVANRRALAMITSVAFFLAVYGYMRSHSAGLEPLRLALAPLQESQDPDIRRTANVVLVAFKEARSTAANWSGVFWGFSFLSAALSAAAALLLKFDSWGDEKRKKDVAVILSLSATLLITISNLGDFHRKWSANRRAAAELELIGYSFVGQSEPDGRAVLRSIGRVQHERNLSIIGQPAEESSSVAAGADPSAE